MNRAESLSKSNPENGNTERVITIHALPACGTAYPELAEMKLRSHIIKQRESTLFSLGEVFWLLFFGWLVFVFCCLFKFLLN